MNAREWLRQFLGLQQRTMILTVSGFSTCLGDDDQLAFVYCRDWILDYCFSLARFSEDELVEVMVRDQINHKTREIEVELTPNCLRISLSSTAAASLDGIREYVIPLNAREEERHELDAALIVLFEGGHRGCYLRRI